LYPHEGLGYMAATRPISHEVLLLAVNLPGNV